MLSKSWTSVSIIFIGFVSVILLSYVVSSIAFATSLETLLIIVVFLICIAPIVVDINRRRFELFSPINVVCLKGFAYYCIASILMVVNDSVQRFNLNLRQELPGALLLAAFGLGVHHIGYAWGSFQFSAERFKGTHSWFTRSINPQTAFRVALIGFLLAVLMFFLWLAIAGVSLSEISYLLDEEISYNTFSKIDNSVLYLFMFRQSWPVLIAMIWVFAPNKFWRYFAVIGWLFTLALLVLGGSRGASLYIAGGTLIFYYLRTGKRPNLLAITVAIIAVLILGSSLVILRSSQRTDLSSDSLLEQVSNELITRGDAVGTMMVTQVFPDRENYLGIDYFSDLLVQPIPRVLWPEKPLQRTLARSMAPYFNIQLPAFDVFANYYGVGGYVGVGFAMFVIGAFNAFVFSMWKASKGGVFRQIMLSFWLMFLFIALSRGSLTWFLPRIIYHLGPIVVVWFLASRKSVPQLNNVSVVSS